MACGITDGVDSSCDKQRRVGGVKKNAYVINLDDIDSYSIDSDGYITAIDFANYAGVYKFESKKQAHSGGSTAVVQEPGGNKFYQHDVTLKIFNTTPVTAGVLEDLLVANVVVILENNNREFDVYGVYNGLEVSAEVENTGQALSSDTADTITLTGGEQVKPMKFLNGTYQQTKNQLDTYVI